MGVPSGWPSHPGLSIRLEESAGKSGVSGYVFHDFRRTASRNMTRAGVPEKHVMQVTGHKTRHMLDRYNITIEQDTYKTMMQTQTYLERAQALKHGQDTDNAMDEGETQTSEDISNTLI